MDFDSACVTSLLVLETMQYIIAHYSEVIQMQT